MRNQVAAALIVVLSACGGGPAVRGELAAGFPAADRVVLAGGGREAPVRGGRFSLGGIEGGSAMLRFLSGGDTVAWLDLENLAGDVDLLGLQVDPASRRAFPSSVRGGERVTVNGVRFAGTAAGADSISEPGFALAASENGSALLFRTDRMGPDLRVRLDSATRILADGEELPGWTVRRGDSLRVAGPVRDGVVIARTIELPAGDSLPTADPDGAILSEQPSASAPDPVPAVRESNGSAPVVRAAPRRDNHAGRGRGHGRGRGKGRKH